MCIRRFLAAMLLFVAGHLHAAIVEQTVAYEQGTPILISRGDFVQVGLMPVEMEQFGRRRMAFMLLVANQTNQSFDVGEHSLTGKIDGAPVVVVSAQTLAREIRRRGAWERFGASLAGGLVAGTAGSNAGHYSQEGTFKGSARGSGYSSRYEGSYAARGYDGAAADQASQRELDRTASILGSMRRAQDARIDEMQQSILMRTTVRAGQELIRTIVLEGRSAPKVGQNVSISISVAGERHDIDFVLSAHRQWVGVPREIVPKALPQAPNSAHEWTGDPTALVAPAPSNPIRPEVGSSGGVQDSTRTPTLLSASIAKTSPFETAAGRPAVMAGANQMAVVSVAPYLDNFSIRPSTTAGGSAMASVVSFSVHWKINHPDAGRPRRILGSLVFSRDPLTLLRVPWSLPSDDEELDAVAFWEFGTGFGINGQPEIAEWLSSVADVNKLVRYEVSDVQY